MDCQSQQVMSDGEPVATNVRPEEGEKREKFGTRYLTDPQSVFQHNAWDNVIWDEEQEVAAQKICEQHVSHAVSLDKRDEFETKAVEYWDKFYGIHQNHFFKDRHWLFTEFPELYGEENSILSDTIGSDSDAGTDPQNNFVSDTAASAVQETGLDSGKMDNGASVGSLTASTSYLEYTTKPQSREHIHHAQMTSLHTSCGKHPSFKLLEVGCGVGNTVFPVLKTNKNPNLMVYCCDFSSAAVDIVKASADYDEKRCHAFVHDITDQNADVPFPPGSLDIIIMIFVLSAICPEKMQCVVNRLASYLKPGGTLLFRDYGRYDMAQLRFKEGRCLSENFYVRGDGTRVYFFTQDDLKLLFEQAGLIKKENLVDRRLQVNRGRQLKMYRVWIQCKYMKPLT